jgi:hypothetical protein
MLAIIVSMKTQNQIKSTLNQPEAIEHVISILNSSGDINRTELADQVCDQFGFLNPLGKKQHSGCIKALRELEKKGHFTLPKSNYTRGKVSPSLPKTPVSEAQGVPDKVEKIVELKLLLVETKEQRQIWNELMINDHPQGAGPFVGCQLYYLITSEFGWLGGFGFSSAALNLEARDKWIGWNWSERKDNLHYLVNMSRFLIRSGVSCKNLASKALSMVIRRMSKDFEARYGYRPLLIESFVDTDHYHGTCYKSSNWQFVGRSKGFGQQEFPIEKKESVKDIYVYPINEDFRVKIGLPEDAGLSALAVASGLNGDHWAKKEFGNAPLGDKRLSNRLVEIAEHKADNPTRSYCGAAGGDWSKVKAYYRFIDKPDESAVTMSNILSPHRERTIRRMKAQQTVLCIQDGSDLNYSNLEKCEGLGIIGSNQTGAKSKGLHLHSTIATTPNGLPLGILRADCNAPQPKSKDDKRSATSIPIEEKKNYCWIESVNDCMDLKKRMPHTKLVNISDREADFFEMFDHRRINSSGVELLIRAKHSRQTKEGQKLFELVKQSPVQMLMKVKVPRKSARPKKSKQKASPKRESRIAEVSVRYRKAELKPPQGYKGKQTIPMWIIHVSEKNTPKEATPLEWFLLTTIELNTVDDARNCLKWYCLRWRIEDWHRVLKSGCKAEELAHETAERLKRAIAINLVIAWRIMLMTLLGREVPDLPADVLFSDLEIEVLNAYAKTRKKKAPDSLGAAIKLVANMGGYIGRTSDPPPGHQIMWQGYSCLQIMCEGYALRLQ